MATFRQRGNRWQAQVRRKGQPLETKSFTSRAEAERWARGIEADIDRGSYVNLTEAHRITLGALIDRYLVDVLPSLKGGPVDAIRLKALKRNRLCALSLAALTPEQIAKFRDSRLTEVSNGTVIRELAYISSIVNHARREWGVHIQNPVALVKKPTSPKGRDRVFTLEEQAMILNDLLPKGRQSKWMHPLVVFALETAMRRGELLALDWKDVDLHKRVATLQDTKNGDRRSVPLSVKAATTLSKLPKSDCGKVFPMTGCAVSAALKRTLSRLHIADSRFHDLRHTAITQIASKLPNVIELSAVSGHKSLRMLHRYYHPDVQELAKKLG
jgi:integrase